MCNIYKFNICILHTHIYIYIYMHTHTHTPLRACCGRVDASSKWVCVAGGPSWCRFQSPISDQTHDSQAMVSGVSSLKKSAQPSGGRKKKGKTPTGGSGMYSTGKQKSGGISRQKVDQYCRCTRHSTFSVLGSSIRAYELRKDISGACIASAGIITITSQNSCRGSQGWGSWGTLRWQCTTQPCIPHQTGNLVRLTDPRGGGRRW